VIGHLDYQLSSVDPETVHVTSPLSVAAFHGPNSKVSTVENGGFSSAELSVPVQRPALKKELTDGRKQRVAAVASNDQTDDGRATPLKFGWNRGGVDLLRKPVISLKRGKIGPRLLLMTNRKSHTLWATSSSLIVWVYLHSFRNGLRKTHVF